ncbi:hypothetical protein Tco_1556906 [Tanacetum coccineum]
MEKTATRPTPLDLSYSGLEEFKEPEVNEYGPLSSAPSWQHDFAQLNRSRLLPQPLQKAPNCQCKPSPASALKLLILVGVLLRPNAECEWEYDPIKLLTAPLSINLSSSRGDVVAAWLLDIGYSLLLNSPLKQGPLGPLIPLSLMPHLDTLHLLSSPNHNRLPHFDLNEAWTLANWSYALAPAVEMRPSGMVARVGETCMSDNMCLLPEIATRGRHHGNGKGHSMGALSSSDLEIVPNSQHKLVDTTYAYTDQGLAMRGVKTNRELIRRSYVMSMRARGGDVLALGA